MTSTYEMLPISRMRLYLASEHEDGYQRDEGIAKGKPRSQHMADTYDEALDDAFIACKGEDVGGRDIVILDAGHRFRMHERRGTEEVMVRLLNGGRYTAPDEQAHLFRKRGGRDEAGVKTTQPLNKVDDHRAGLAEGDVRCRDIQDVIDRYGLEAGARASDSKVSLSSLQNIYDRSQSGERGRDYARWLLRETFAVLTEVYPVAEADRHNGHLIEGLALVIHSAVQQKQSIRYGHVNFVKALRQRKWSPTRMQDEARRHAHKSSMGYNTRTNWASLIREVVDKGIFISGKFD